MILGSQIELCVLRELAKTAAGTVGIEAVEDSGFF
jgi:hypothetical protein